MWRSWWCYNAWYAWAIGWGFLVKLVGFTLHDLSKVLCCTICFRFSAAVCDNTLPDLLWASLLVFVIRHPAAQCAWDSLSFFAMLRRPILSFCAAVGNTSPGCTVCLRVLCRWGCSSVGRISDRHNSLVRQEIFLTESTFQCRLSYGVRTLPCAFACIYICAHFKDPVVHVRIRWIMATETYLACNISNKIINLMIDHSAERRTTNREANDVQTERKWSWMKSRLANQTCR